MRNYISKSKILFIIPVLWMILFASGWLQLQEEKKNNVKMKIEKDKKAPEETDKQGPADTVKIGAYVLSIYDLDFPSNKVSSDFYIWYNAKKDSLNLVENFEIINAIESNKSHVTNEKRDDLIYQTFRVNSVIKKQWDIAHFPFDKQNIEINIEDYDKDNKKLIFIPDTAESKLDPDVNLSGWKITDFGIKVNDHVYETNYGDPELKPGDYSTYSRVVIYSTIERDGNGIFFKLFIGLFISVLMSLVSFFIDPSDLDPRFGLPVGAIFAAIASQYVITSTLPQNSRITLVDKLHDLSFIYIFISIIVSVISLYFRKHDKIPTHKKLDKYSFLILSISYITIVTYFVLMAI
ncbi:MAG TPA: hypothetical protein VGK25_12485 [Ignavibacteria bacterium]|jgi:hypothetical protein